MNTGSRLLGITLGVMLVGAVSGSRADQEIQSQQGSTGAGTRINPATTLDYKDKKFIQKAAKDGMAEVEMARLAQRKTSSEQVREFAAQMEQDHRQANDELRQIGESKGISIPASLDSAQNKKIAKFRKETGSDFDRKYMADMVLDHEEDLKFFREASQDAADPEVKGFAQKTEQKISEHLDLARKVAAQVGAITAKPEMDGSNAASHANSGTNAGTSGDTGNSATK
jgi:putative membrane protein